jgi:heme exporter protein CcmD
MESTTMPPQTYGAGTDPTPYIAGAYGIGAALIVGFAIWIVIERRHLRRLMEALKKST